MRADLSRAVVELAGVRDILTKSRRSNNAVNVVKATFEGLKKLRIPEEEFAKRRRTVEEMKEQKRLREERRVAKQAAIAEAAAQQDDQPASEN